MKKLVSIAFPALIASVVGSLVRQKLKGTEELVVAAHPVPVAAGVIAGLLVPGAKPFVAAIVSLNVAANYPR